MEQVARMGNNRPGPEQEQETGHDQDDAEVLAMEWAGLPEA